MPTQGFFSVPIYHDMIEGNIFDKIQKEFTIVEEDLNSKKLFAYKEYWHPGTHQISDTTFTKNLLLDYNLKTFEKELSNHVTAYLQSIDAPAERFQAYRVMQCWMTKTGKNEYAHLHNHGRCDISGVYYFKTNGVDGSIGFRNPTTQFWMSYFLEHLKVDIVHKPHEGKIILFPGWLDHDVSTNYTDHERISISFNINFQKPDF